MIASFVYVSVGLFVFVLQAMDLLGTPLVRLLMFAQERGVSVAGGCAVGCAGCSFARVLLVAVGVPLFFPAVVSCRCHLALAGGMSLAFSRRRAEKESCIALLWPLWLHEGGGRCMYWGKDP